MDKGAEVGAYHTRITLQHNGLGCGGDTETVLQTDLTYLRSQKLIKLLKQDHIAARYGITKHGTNLLKGIWEDPRGIHNDAILASEPPRADEYEKNTRSNYQDRESITHPSFGAIGLFHTSGTSNLFGATIPHSHFLTLRIGAASLERSLHTDRHFSQEEYVEVKFTIDQFVSILFSANQGGDGSPCTLSRIFGERIKEPPQPVSQRTEQSTTFSKDFVTMSADALSLAIEAEELLKRAGAMKAKDKARLRLLLDRISLEVRANLLTMKSQFEEQMARTVSTANTELNNTLRQTVKHLGLAKLGHHLQLPNLSVEHADNNCDVDEPEDAAEPEVEVITHPSFGTISIEHSQGNARLFGATSDHSHYLTIRITGATLSRSSRGDVHTATDEHIAVRLSYDHFVSLLFSSNQGSGVQCTITRQEGVDIEEPPRPPSKRDQFRAEFHQSLAVLNKESCQLADEATRLLGSPGAVKVADKAALADLLRGVTQDVSSNLAFAESQFQKQVDKSVAEVHSLLQGSLRHTMESIGLAALRGELNLPTLEDSQPHA
jgi:hypothetical protein